VLSEFLADVQSLVASVGAQLPPDGDWATILVLESREDEDGNRARSYCRLDSSTPFTPRRKSVLFLVTIPALVKRHDADRFALIFTALRKNAELADRMGYDPRRPLSEDPLAIECVAVYAFDRDSRTMSLADIDRHFRAAPTLREWSEPSSGGDGRIHAMWTAAFA
jgi:hypothetical protein